MTSHDNPSDLPRFEADKDAPAAHDRQTLDFVRRAASLRRQLTLATRIGFGSIFSSVPVMLFLCYYSGDVVSTIPIAMFCVGIGGMLWGVAVGLPLGKMEREAGTAHDKRKIGILLDAFRTYSRFVNHPLRDPKQTSSWEPRLFETAGLLSRLLPQIEAEDIVLFSPAQRAVLHDLLRDQDAHLVMGVLKALSSIGNSGDLPTIQKLAQGAWKAAEDPRLAQAAEETHTRIKARLTQQSQPQTLLRSSIRPKESSAHLLHPVIRQPDKAEVAQLLRADKNKLGIPDARSLNDLSAYLKVKGTRRQRSVRDWRYDKNI